MKLCRCPVCHSDIHLDALLEDDAGRETRNVVALTNHNYLKKVYEGAKPLFAVVRSEQGKSAVKNADKLAEDKRTAAIQYIERYAAIGKLEFVKNMPEYLVWKAWKEEQNATTNP